MSRPEGGYILLRSQVLNVLESFSQSEDQHESGGILLGSYRGDHIEVVHATNPAPSDDRSPVSFNRLRQCHQQSAEEMWAASNGTVTYIGEWHTHPELTPNPSQIDLNSWKNLLPQRPMVLLIQGYNEIYIGLQTADRKFCRVG